MEENQVIEDIRYIKQMIENNRRMLVDNGIIYIGTGIFTVVGTIITYLLDFWGFYSSIPTLWLAMTLAFVIIIIAVQNTRKKKQAKKTFASQVFNATWGACGAPVFVVSILFFTTGNVSINTFFTVIATSLGIGYYLTGVINNLKFMRLLAFGWWGGAVLALMWNKIGSASQLSMLFVALIFLFELIPGIIIYIKWKKVYNV